MDAMAPVGGIRILREAGTSILNASYLPEGSAVFCRFLAPRKVSVSDSVRIHLLKVKVRDHTVFQPTCWLIAKAGLCNVSAIEEI